MAYMNLLKDTGSVRPTAKTPASPSPSPANYPSADYAFVPGMVCECDYPIVQPERWAGHSGLGCVKCGRHITTRDAERAGRSRHEPHR